MEIFDVYRGDRFHGLFQKLLSSDKWIDIHIPFFTDIKMIKVKDKPSLGKVKTSDARKKLLLIFSKNIYVPYKFEQNKLVPFYEYFFKNEDLATVKLVQYFNKIRAEKDFKQWSDTIRKAVSDLDKSGILRLLRHLPIP